MQIRAIRVGAERAPYKRQDFARRPRRSPRRPIHAQCNFGMHDFASGHLHVGAACLSRSP